MPKPATEPTGPCVEYDHNNSGGRWWLTDDDWRALEAAGWRVAWYAHQENAFLRPDNDGRFLGALASKAKRYGLTLREAAAEWERIVGKATTDAGCPCCGPPHSFTEYDENGHYVDSGPDTSYTASW